MLPSLADPETSNAALVALKWIETAATGSIGRIIATLAIAGIGAAMLTGRWRMRESAAILLGCFLLFGAATIAAGLRAFTAGNSPGAPEYAVIENTPPPKPQGAASYDPYAGASVPFGAQSWAGQN